MATLRKALKESEPMLDRVKQAVKMPYCVLQKDWSLGAAVPFREFARMKAIARALAFRSEMEAKEGNVAAMSADLGTAFTVGRQAGSMGGMLIGMLVDVALNAITLASVERIASKHPKDAPILNALGDVVARHQDLPSFRGAMKGEALIGRLTILWLKDKRGFGEMSSAFGGADPGDKLFGIIPKVNRISAAPVSVETVKKAFETRLLQFYIRLLPKLSDDTSTLVEQSAWLDQQAIVESEKKGLSYTLNKIMFPVFAQAGASVVRLRANQLTMLTYVKALQYRVRHGAFPSGLAELGPVPTDPFDGKPLRYQLENGGFVVYSVGQDKTDNGGKTKVKNRMPPNQPGWDIAFRYP
jgi:hypothetical protein